MTNEQIRAGCERMKSDVSLVRQAVRAMLTAIPERMMPTHEIIGNLDTIAKGLDELSADVDQLSAAAAALNGDGAAPKARSVRSKFNKKR